MLINGLISLKNHEKNYFLNCRETRCFGGFKKSFRKIDRVFLTEDAQRKLNRENQNLNYSKKPIFL